MIDPRGESGDFLFGERITLIGHALVGVGAVDPLDQLALGAFADDDPRAVLSALEQHFTGGEVQIALALAVAVTFKAPVRENRQHLAAELHWRRGLGSMVGGRTLGGNRKHASQE